MYETNSLVYPEVVKLGWLIDGTKDINISTPYIYNSTILENQNIKVIFGSGGAINEIYDKINKPTFNLVDNNDIGRLVQIALFYMNGGNPTQAGCNSSIESPILNTNITENSLYTKTRLLDWGTCSESDILLEQTTTIDKNIITINYKLSHEGNETHMLTAIGGQLPVAYLNPELTELQYVQNNEINKIVLPEDREFVHPEENWVALTNNNLGIALVNFDLSDVTTWEIGKWYGSNPLLLHGLYEYVITPNWELSWKVYCIIGNIDSVRETAIQLKPVAEIAIAPTILSINVGNTAQLSTTCKDDQNILMTCPILTWLSDNTQIAGVNSSGLVTGVATGSANITANASGITSNISTITVIPQIPLFCSWVLSKGGATNIAVSDIMTLVSAYLGHTDVGFPVTIAHIMGGVAYYLHNVPSGNSLTGCVFT